MMLKGRSQFFLLEYINLPPKGSMDKIWKHSGNNRCVLVPFKLKTSNSADETCFEKKSIKKLKDFEPGQIVFVETADSFAKISNNDFEYFITKTKKVWRKAKILQEVLD